MQLVMFDIDGTLVDSSGFDAELYAQAVQEVIRVEVDRTWLSYRNVTDSGILTELLEDRVDDAERRRLAEQTKARFIKLVGAYLEDERHPVRPIAGAATLIERLRSIPGVALAIATGGWRETAEMKLARAGISAAGIPLASSSEAERRIDVMRLAEQRAAAGRTFSRRTFFGDGPWDQKASQELGYAFIGVGGNVKAEIGFPDLSDQEAILEVLGLAQ